VREKATDRCAAAVHEGLRLGQKDRLFIPPPAPENRLAALFAQANPGFRGQPSNHPKSQIMPRQLVAFARIPQADDQFHRTAPTGLTQDSPSFGGSVATGAASAPSTGAAAAAGASSTVGGTTETRAKLDS